MKSQRYTVIVENENGPHDGFVCYGEDEYTALMKAYLRENVKGTCVIHMHMIVKEYDIPDIKF